MKQSYFVQQHEALWQSIENWLDYQQLPAKERRKQTVPAIDFPADYRRLCHHLALAQSRMYSPLLTERLNNLVTRGHHQLYSSRIHFWHHLATFYLHDFPALVRKEYKLLALASLLFFGTYFGMLIAIQIEPQLIYSVVDGEQVAVMEAMYDPQNKSRLGREREADSDIFMFGYYIRNNTGIGFNVFAGGLIYGLGTLFFLLFNGIVLGAISGHLTHIGYNETFWSFVVGHSSFELTAIVLSGVAGLKLAEALVAPGRKTRRLALLDNSQLAIRIVYGAATLFTMAAFVEAFWSSQTIIPPLVKYLVGIALWLVLMLYFFKMGRHQAAGLIA
ncbi:MAG: hypothetical protein CR991_00215 [Proteobacteria bacterium]|nr:MAG: hypothetical protein CR991_00215 [Pseudomonadota bacterium]